MNVDTAGLAARATGLKMDDPAEIRRQQREQK
jgi:hypothetical protein